MAAKVFLPGGEQDYPEGQAAKVVDGHLYISTWPTGGSVIAIYAPGKWTSVDVSTNAKA